MQIIRKTLLIILFCTLLFCCFQQIAFSYVLQGNHIVDLMTKNMGLSKSLVVEQKQIVFGEVTGQEEEGVIAVLNETVSYSFPDKVRSDVILDTDNNEIQSNEIQKITLFSHHETVRVLDGKIVSQSVTPLDQYKKILLFRDRILMENYLYSRGVDIAISSLGQFENQTAYIVGAKYPDETSAQLWVYHDTFLPFRFIIPGGIYDNFAFLEIRFLNWEKNRKIWYPMKLELYADGVPIKNIVSNNLIINKTFSETFFSIKFFKEQYPIASFETNLIYDGSKHDNPGYDNSGYDNFKNLIHI